MTRVARVMSGGGGGLPSATQNLACVRAIVELMRNEISVARGADGAAAAPQTGPAEQVC